jgi:hypothetical protein
MLPTVLVSLGLGSVIASTFEIAPWLATIGRHKTIVFAAVGALLGLNYWIAIVGPQRAACAPGEACHVDSRVMRVNRALFWTSVVIYASALTFTCAALWWIARQP